MASKTTVAGVVLSVIEQRPELKRLVAEAIREELQSVERATRTLRAWLDVEH